MRGRGHDEIDDCDPGRRGGGGQSQAEGAPSPSPRLSPGAPVPAGASGSKSSGVTVGILLSGTAAEGGAG